MAGGDGGGGEQPDEDVYDLMLAVAEGDASRLDDLDALLPQEQRIELRNMRSGACLGSWQEHFKADRGLWAVMERLWSPHETVDPRLGSFHAWVAIRRAYDLIFEGRLPEAGSQAAAFEKMRGRGHAPKTAVRRMLMEAANIAAYAALDQGELATAEALLERAAAESSSVASNLSLVRLWRATPKNDRDLVRGAQSDLSEYAKLNWTRSRLDAAHRSEAGDSVFFRLPLDESVFSTPDTLPRLFVPPLRPLPRRTAQSRGSEIETIRARAAVKLLKYFRTTAPHLDRHRAMPPQP
ncbi:hypothetical protein ACFXPI_05645 [Streptomyces sp. NPDC059104]|uniref:hypothetical protein n=1 Tax=Streptomyces sp. NPDC059104 TaxID=3346729 RepID=UPI0036C82FFC